MQSVLSWVPMPLVLKDGTTRPPHDDGAVGSHRDPRALLSPGQAAAGISRAFACSCEQANPPSRSLAAKGLCDPPRVSPNANRSRQSSPSLVENLSPMCKGSSMSAGQRMIVDVQPCSSCLRICALSASKLSAAPDSSTPQAIPRSWAAECLITSETRATFSACSS